MQKTELYGAVFPFLGDYRQMHQRTADLDIVIVRKFAEGKNAIQIAMEVPCAEATVYRAIKRVDQFLMQKTKLCQSQSFQNVHKKD